MRRVIITIVLVLICASLGFIGIKYAGEKGSNPVNNDSSIELSSNSEISNENSSLINNYSSKKDEYSSSRVIQNENSSLINNSSNKKDEPSNEIKDVIYDFDKITKENNTNHITLGHDLIEKATENKYTINLIFKNIKLNNNSYTVMLKNYSPNDIGCEKGKNKVLYINNRILKEFEIQRCYIVGLDEIVVLNNKYLILILEYSIQNKGEMFIFNEYGKEITFPENVHFEDVLEIENEYIIYRSKGKEDVGCVWSKYKMEIKNDETINTSLGKVTYENCK